VPRGKSVLEIVKSQWIVMPFLNVACAAKPQTFFAFSYSLRTRDFIFYSSWSRALRDKVNFMRVSLSYLRMNSL